MKCTKQRGWMIPATQSSLFGACLGDIKNAAAVLRARDLPSNAAALEGVHAFLDGLPWAEVFVPVQDQTLEIEIVPERAAADPGCPLCADAEPSTVSALPEKPTPIGIAMQLFAQIVTGWDADHCRTWLHDTRDIPHLGRETELVTTRLEHLEEPSVCIAGNPTVGDRPCGDPDCVCFPDGWIPLPDMDAWYRYRYAAGILSYCPMFRDGTRDAEHEAEIENLEQPQAQVILARLWSITRPDVSLHDYLTPAKPADTRHVFDSSISLEMD